MLGMALFELERYDDAKTTFVAAQSAPEARTTAAQWIDYIEREQARLGEIRRAMDR
jgi:hypothetical protein